MLARICPSLAAAAVLASTAAPAAAELSQPVRAMIEAAIGTGDATKVRTVVDIAKQTNPDDVAEIDELHRAFQANQREIAAAEAARKEEALRTAGLLDNWSGRGQVGAFQSSGNSDDVGVTLALNLERKGVDWQHKLRGTADYRRSSGRTSREQFLAAYEPRYVVNRRLFAYSLAQYERDRLRGIGARYSLSGGLGYQAIDARTVKLAVKAGPSWRQVDFVDGRTEGSFGALAGLDFDWYITPRLTLTQDGDLVADAGGSATAIIDSSSTSVLLTTGLEAKMNDRLTTRLSYTVDYDSNPRAGAVSTDTLTRFTLVYGF